MNHKRTGIFITQAELVHLKTEIEMSGMLLLGGMPMGDPGVYVQFLCRKYGQPDGSGVDAANGEFVVAQTVEDDPYESVEYERFVASMAKYCHCEPPNPCPCDAVLAGGVCDGVRNPPDCEQSDECDDAELLPPNLTQSGSKQDA